MYVFKSKAAADLVMMQPAGDQLLRIVGREPSPSGIIEAAAIPAAMQAIEAAISVERSEQPRQDDEAGQDRKEPRVGLAQRAWPMLEMMKRAVSERADIVWGA